MKKFTALMLVVLMVVSFVPFGAFAATEWTEVKTAEDFAKMTDGNYWLTADIDLSKVAWTTIAEFSGTLNGNGKTVTVPADALLQHPGAEGAAQDRLKEVKRQWLRKRRIFTPSLRRRPVSAHGCAAASCAPAAPWPPISR